MVSQGLQGRPLGDGSTRHGCMESGRKMVSSHDLVNVDLLGMRGHRYALIVWAAMGFAHGLGRLLGLAVGSLHRRWIMGMTYNHKGQTDHQRTSIPHTDSQSCRTLIVSSGLARHYVHIILIDYSKTDTSTMPMSVQLAFEDRRMRYKSTITAFCQMPVKPTLSTMKHVSVNADTGPRYQIRLK